MVRLRSGALLLTTTSVIFAGVCSLPVARAAGQQTDSVAEAARKAREAKKNANKPAKVLTEDDLKRATPGDPGVQQAAAVGAGSAQASAAAGPAGETASGASARTGAATAAVSPPVSEEEPKQPIGPAASGGLAVGGPPRPSSVGPSTQDVAEADAAGRKAKTSPADNPVKESDSAEVKAAKAELAVAEADLEAAKDELALENDNVYRNPDYAHDRAGQAKLDGLKQQVTDRQAEVEKKRAKVTEAVAKSAKP